MPAGTIYMYYARGGDSLNISCGEDGDAVLIKSGLAHFDAKTSETALKRMQKNNPKKNSEVRTLEKLCSGQTLLCKSLGITVKKWNAQQFDPTCFYIDDIGERPEIIQTTRLGIRADRDAHLPYRFIARDYEQYCTKKLTKAEKSSWSETGHLN